MSSQLDLDQGGIVRQWTRSYMGPSIGWTNAPLQNIFPITAAGTYTLDPSTNYVPVNVAGAVTIILPSAVNPLVVASTQPGLFTNPPVVIADVGGNAAAHPITIQRNNTNESIMGLVSIQITINYAAFTLAPNSAQKTWNSISP